MDTTEEAGEGRVIGRCMAEIVLLCLPIFAAAAAESDYPARPVRIIVPYPPGSSDVTARILAQKLNERLGQPFIVDNRGGSTGEIGTNMAAKAPPDGHTLLFHTCTFAISAAMQKPLPYRVPQDFTAIALAAYSPVVLVASRSLAAGSVKELIALAKAAPDALNYGSVGAGSVAFVAAEMFKRAAGVRLTEVIYQGTTPALNSILSGETQVMFSVFGAGLPHIRAGRMKALAMASAARSALLPDLPTVAEAGLAGFDAMCWQSVLGPRGIPPAVVNRLNTHIVAALGAPDMRAQLAALGFEPALSSPAQFRAYLDAEVEKWSRAMRAVGVKLKE
jgi:tripartite-type tricarboxylate transporter receptor subunit TctC